MNQREADHIHIPGCGDFKIVLKFFSRINSVYLAERSGSAEKVIIKDFGKETERLQAELNGMTVFKDFSPEIFYSDDRYIVHEFIEGETMLSVFEELERSGKDPACLISGFVTFLEDMYKSAPGYILSDINFTNFIIKEVSGDYTFRFVDYESVSKGKVEEDIGKIAAFALTYDPAFTDWKYDFALRYIENSLSALNISEEKIYKYLENELKAMNDRRKFKIDIPEVMMKLLL